MGRRRTLETTPRKRMQASARAKPPLGRRATPLALLCAAAMACAALLPFCAPPPALAIPDTISGTCYVECTNPEIDGAQGGNVFAVSFPQYGIETTGYCISGPLYGTPVPGHYPFTGTRTSDGGYRIVIDCSGAAMYPNHSSPFGPQDVGDFVIYLHGSLEVVKQGVDGYAEAVPEATLAGARYELVDGDSAVQAVLTTGSDGRAEAAEVPIGTYTLRETDPSHGYGLDEGPQTVTVRGGQTTRASSREAPLLGGIEVAKSSSMPHVTNGNPCYSLSGAVYGVYADAACEREVQRIVTGEDGRGTGEATLWPGEYWVKEIEPPAGYALDGQVHPVRLTVEDCRQNVAVRVDAADEPQLRPVDVIAAKKDAETGQTTAQGGATLAGAVFSVEHYAGSFGTPEEAAASGLSPTFSATVVTDEDGRARLDSASLPANSAGAGLPLGTVVVRETKAPEGYLLADPATIALPVTAEGTGPLAPLLHEASVPERIVRGDIAVLKVGDGEGTMGDQSVKRPLAGVAFDILDPESGQSVARIVTDEDGFATTAGLRENGQVGALPFGTYLVREDPSTTPAGYEPVAEFRATVAENGRTYAYTVEDETGTVVRIVKKDAETGRRVNGRMTFRILDERKQPLAFQVGAGGPIVSEFATDEEGVCTLPDKLNGGGTYYVQETCPPPGYVLNDEPAAFSLADRDEEGIVEVVVEDLPQTGRIEVRKVDADTGAPIAQPGIVWEVRAVQDVVTADRTVRAQAGETVALLESDDDGTAVAEGLHLGAYVVVETCAPDGYVRSSEPAFVRLAYGDPEARSVSVALDAPNRKAAGVIEIGKTDAAGKGPVPNAAYEVRAAHDIVAPDGTTALAAGEVAATLVTDEEGFACSAPLPLGSYEVVETKAPEGYLVDAEAHPVELVYEGQDVPVVRASLTLVDEPVPAPEPIAETGDSTRALLAAALLAALSLAATACAARRARAKRCPRRA